MREEYGSAVALDAANAAYWDELCGTAFARSVGVTSGTADELDRFDSAYMRWYPWLKGYLSEIEGEVLEIGPGFGTVGRELLRAGRDYAAVDIAPGPVSMARESLIRFGRDPARAVRASALDLPYDDAAFDSVVAIGSLHHTGNLGQSLAEARRVLRPKGTLLLMVYNAHSANRLLTVPLARGAARLWPSRSSWILTRTYRDHNTRMETAPHTDFVTRRGLARLLADFHDHRIELQNVSPVTVNGRTLIRAETLTPMLRRWGALDLYAVAHR